MIISTPRDEAVLYRFLDFGELIEPGDECPSDSCQRWESVNRWAIGQPRSSIFKIIRRRAPAPASGVDAVAVKALEWRSHAWGAEADGGRYRIEDNGTNWTDDRYWLFVNVGLLSNHRSKFATLDEAKAAAQADYEQRIRSALSPAATPAHIENCGEDREAKMVVLRTDETGKPTVWCDPCIAPVVMALNDAGIETVSSCCGHSHRPGVIGLKDGRVLMLLSGFEDYQRAEALWTTDINGAATPVSEARPPITPAIAPDAKWCQPGDQQHERYFLVRYDDPDCRDRVFTDEQLARDAWAKSTLHWNCWLFAAMPVNPTPVSEAGGEAITARYTNWQGVTAERTFIPHRVFFGSNEWHPEPQVLIEATDCEKGALRTFAAAGFSPVPEFTYSSTQTTKCAGCGEHKHTPLRRDEMGGYVCLTCIDKALAKPACSPADLDGVREAAQRVIAEGRIASGGIRRPAKWIHVPGKTWSRLQAALSRGTPVVSGLERTVRDQAARIKALEDRYEEWRPVSEPPLHIQIERGELFSFYRDDEDGTYWSGTWSQRRDADIWCRVVTAGLNGRAHSILEKGKKADA